MNTQERDQLTQLLKSLIEYKLPTKDAEAEGLIRDAVARQPDAAYLLVQRALLMDHALNSAKAQIDQLQKQLQSVQSPIGSGSFLGSDPWAQPVASSGPVPGATNYQPAPRYAPQAQAPAPQPAQSGGLFGGGSSFLGNMATTAAGVVAGGFLFQGIESLMGHHGGGFGGGGFGGGGFGQQPFGGEQITENTVVNNYYGDDAGSQLADNNQYGAGQYANDSYSGNDFLTSSSDDSFMDDSGSSDSDWI
ncbi:DUF2076 domain-containing protein [Methylomonas sp. AM2-LC]|uniref:DUF2076 domain-containing protein n=1 Tax=Methylomonas sp. AM2-LC TaxID=3153301 RepID=UPI0032649751